MDASETGRVIVGVRASLGGYQALRYGAEQARRQGALLVAVRAIGTDSYGATLPREAAVDGVRAVFLAALGELPRDLTVQVVARAGAAGAVLVQVANRESDLLIIGGSGAHRFTGAWSGTVARFCGRRAGCPVVIVPPPAMARAGRPGQLARAAARGAERHLCAPPSSDDRRLPRP